jgi:hypothetical protein
MTTFQKPNYSKIKNSSGGFDPSYTFPLKLTNFLLSSVINYSEKSTNESLLVEELKVNVKELHNFVKSFLEFSSSYFSKPYTTEAIIRHMNHRLHNTSTDEGEDGQQVIFTPMEIVIYNGRFTLVWGVEYKVLKIEIPDLDEKEKVEEVKGGAEKNSTDDGLEQIEDIENKIVDNEELVLKDSSRQYERHRVKEAQLKARLAAYKAERVTHGYLEKYGDEVSDSDSESSDEDEESDDDLI